MSRTKTVLVLTGLVLVGMIIHVPNIHGQGGCEVENVGDAAPSWDELRNIAIPYVLPKEILMERIPDPADFACEDIIENMNALLSPYVCCTYPCSFDIVGDTTTALRISAISNDAYVLIDDNAHTIKLASPTVPGLETHLTIYGEGPE